METTSQAYIKRYNESARRFKILFVLNRDLQNMDFGGQQPVPPFDLNQIYGRMTVLRKMLDNPQPEQIKPIIEDVENQIATAWHWYEALDKQVTPFILRSYCERNPDLPTEHMMLLLQFILNKSEHTELDQGKVDYLLTQTFCVTDQSGAIRLRAASEDELRKQIEGLFPVTHTQSQDVERLTKQLGSLISEIFQVSTFESLITGDYINRGRRLKASMGKAFYHPSVLAKCVQLNTLLRQKFMQLYSIESENIKKFSELLINTGKNQIGLAEGGLSVASALEFSESTGQMLSADYSANSERLRTFVRIRELLTKAVTSYGLDPKHASSVEAVDLDEESLAARLNARREWLRRVLSEQAPQRLATALQIVELERSRLVVSGWERDALLANKSDSANQAINDLLSRAAALISEINESYAYYRSQSTTAPHLSDTHLMAVNYYIMQAHQLANELEQMSNQMRENGNIERAADLSATRHKLLDTCWKIKV